MLQNLYIALHDGKNLELNYITYSSFIHVEGPGHVAVWTVA